MVAGKQAPNAWSVLVLLFLANLLNFFDRAIPAIINEPVRLQFHLNDVDLGLIAAAFTVVYAIASIPLGRLADLRSRRIIMSVGLAAWSVFTGLNGFAWSFGSYLAARMAVGVGEASYGPAAISLIGDLFPANRRSRATGVYMLGLPFGLTLAFFTTGAIVKAAATWRAAFLAALLPGLVLALCVAFIREPARGAAEEALAATAPISRPIRRVLRIRTMWWLILSGIAMNFSAYAANSFLVPLLQRYHGVSLQQAAMGAGFVLGVAGLVGLTFGGLIADWIHQRSRRGRLLFGAGCLAIAAAAIALALSFGRAAVGPFIAVFAAGWLLQYQYYTCVYPAIQDVVEPRLRATAVAVYFACLYLLGGAFGPVVVGLLSDHYARAARLAAGATIVTAAFKAAGLHDAMVLIPAALLVTAATLVVAAMTFRGDADAMRQHMAKG